MMPVLRFFCLICCLVLLPVFSYAVEPIPSTHAHNDYLNERPLLDALDNGFLSVEADVHFIAGQLYVSHDPPKVLDPITTLEALYLKPLARRIAQNGGRVYEGYDGPFYLMIDIKTAAAPTYDALQKLLHKYQPLIAAITREQTEEHKPVRVFLSGNRPIEQILSGSSGQGASLMALDGRPDDLGSGIPTSLMPVISENYRRFVAKRGEATPAEVNKLKAFIKAAHSEGKLVRLWAAPDNRDGWQFLKDIGVDLINTDKLAELRLFLRKP